MKNILLICVLLLAIVFSLAACGGEDNSKNNETPVHTHNFSEWEISKMPTCTENGTKVRYCSCGEKQSEFIALTGHIEVIDTPVEATCTETGLTEGKHCSVCNEVFIAQIAIDALGHTEVMDAAVEPTCTKTGLTEGKHCSVCNEVFIAQIAIDALGHTEVIDTAVEPTCTEAGLTEGKHCSVCNEVLVEQQVVLANGHNYSDGVCSNCGDKYSVGLEFTSNGDGTCYVDDISGKDTDVIIPSISPDGDRVTGIDQYAFSDCDITSIFIPSSVTSIGYGAFASCTSLTNITVEEDNENYKSIDGNLYTKDGTTIVQYAIGKEDTTFTIPDTVTNIGDYAFAYCNFHKIVIQNNVTSIGKEAFRSSPDLDTVIIKDNVTHIEFGAFFDCRCLVYVVISPSVTTISYHAFCSSTIQHIFYTGSEEEWNKITIDKYAFYYVDGVEIHYNHIPEE